MRNAVLLLLAFAVIGCATADTTAERPPEVSRPEIIFAQQGDLIFGGGDEAPVHLLAQIRNTSKVPLVVREIQVDSPQQMYSTVQRTSRVYAETIPPGETRTLPFTALVSSSTPERANEEPLSIRAFVLFDVEGKRFRESVVQRNLRQVR